MTLPLDLEDWLTNEGGRVVENRAIFGESALLPEEGLIYEIWLPDTETRNGGLSQ